ncbi:hypothetical protein J2W51_003307 [Tardiphaga robiniae]|nr:hypothetical protein [Tardiphaga robiniae]
MRDPALDVRQVPARDPIDLCARLIGSLAQGQQFGDIGDLEAELAGVPDEIQAGDIPGR